MRGFTICRILKGRRSLRQTAAAIPRGTETIMDPNTTNPVPTNIDKAPNSAGDPDGYHRVEVKILLYPRFGKRV